MIKIFIAGHRGMVGSAIYRKLKSLGNILILTKERSDLDLLDQLAVNRFLSKEVPDLVYMAGAKVGGILANSRYPAQFIYENLTIQSNIIHGSYLAGVKQLLFLGSSCVYPKGINRPIKEEDLLAGKIEPTNEPYAIAKIAGAKLCESYNREYGLDYRSVMPTNLYGCNDSYHAQNSHVIPALILRFHEAKYKKAKSVTVWGSGNPCREFLFVDDFAEACIFIMNLERDVYWKLCKSIGGYINVGFGSEISIRELANKIKNVVGYEGEIKFDNSYPDGVNTKILNSSIIQSLGWTPKTNFETGLQITYKDFLSSRIAI
jgi:GDP-L-fucose synthase